MVPSPRSIQKGNKETLTELWLGALNGLAWSPSGDEILFVAAAYGLTTSLYAVNRSGRQRLIAHLPGNFSLLDVASDGRLLMNHTVFSIALFYLPTVDSEETDLYCTICLGSPIFLATGDPYCSSKVGTRIEAVRTG